MADPKITFLSQTRRGQSTGKQSTGKQSTDSTGKTVLLTYFLSSPQLTTWLWNIHSDDYGNSDCVDAVAVAVIVFRCFCLLRRFVIEGGIRTASGLLGVPAGSHAG